MKITIGMRLAFGFGLALLILVTIGFISSRSTSQLLETNNWVSHTHKVLEHLELVLSELQDAETGQRGYIITGEDRYLEPYNSATKIIEKEINDVRELTADNPGQQHKIKEIKSLIDSKFAELKETIDLRRTQGFDAALKIVVTDKGKKIMDDIRIIIAEMENEEYALLLKRERDAETTAKTTKNIINFGTIIAFIFLSLVSIYITRRITRPLGIIAARAKEIAASDADLTKTITVTSSDEIGDLTRSFNNMIVNLKVSRNERLVFADNLEKNAEQLEQSNFQLEEQTKLKTNIAELNDQMRGDPEPHQLGDKILNHLIPYLNAQIGSFYVVSEDDLLKLVSTYAHPDRKNLANEFHFGESIVGQAALEKKSIVINNVPDDYIKISSGLGIDVPGNIFVIPILFEEEVKGVLEIGSFKALTDSQRVFLENVNGDIGIGLNGALARITMKGLLEETQQQSEELQSQQEELRTSNEELEEQAKVLKESEANLQAQQEELRQTNEELEDQGENLKEKHREVEMARKIVEEKAEELRMTGKYKSEFLANMSHELRTPLNSTLILAKLLSQNKNGNLNEKQVEYAQTIYQSGNDLLVLINEVLDLSKVEAGKLDINIEDVNLAGFAAYVKKNFEHMAQDKGLYLKIEVADGIPKMIHTDRRRLEQIIKNFFSNALKFTEKGGITLKIHQSITDSGLHARGLSPQNAIAISVSDTGIGIPQEKQDTVFGAFQQADGGTSRKYGGTGLGLTISKELAHLLGGEIELKSVEGEGSAFTIYLPLMLAGKQGEGLTRESKGSLSETIQKSLITKQEPKIRPVGQITELDDVRDDRRDVSHNDKSILIIEDDPHFAKILQDLAHDRGFKVLIAGDGKTALHLADHHKPSAIVLDIKLPDMDGRMVLGYLKDNLKTRHIPVHVMSGEDVGSQTLKMGAMGFFTKPIEADKLSDAFEKLEEMFSRKVKRLLVVEDNEVERKCIVELIADSDVDITMTGKGQEALDLIKSNLFDCMILDLKLPDMSGFKLLEKLKENKKIASRPPVIVYTGKDLSTKEEDRLRKYSESIIIKSVKSPERLLDETTLFLHRVEEDLPKEKREMLQLIHNKEIIFEEKNILVVDDDMRNIFALTSILEDKGVQIHVGKNGKEALEKLNKETAIDLVLMDIMMPEMDGYEAMTEIRKKPQFKELPIIALTAKAMKGDKEKCIQAGANDYISKPVDTDKLLSMMRVWLYK